MKKFFFLAAIAVFAVVATAACSQHSHRILNCEGVLTSSTVLHWPHFGDWDGASHEGKPPDIPHPNCPVKIEPEGIRTTTTTAAASPDTASSVAPASPQTSPSTTTATAAPPATSTTEPNIDSESPPSTTFAPAPSSSTSAPLTQEPVIAA